MGWSGVALAQAEVKFEKALLAFKQARFDESLVLLDAAQGETTDPPLLAKIHLYIGVNRAVLGEEQKALEAFGRALVHDPQVTLDPERIKESIVQLFEKARSDVRGTLVVTANVAEASVWLDDERLGRAPVERRVAVGAHRIRVQAPGVSQPFETDVVVYYQDTTRVLAVLVYAGNKGGPDAGSGRFWTWVAAGSSVAFLALGTGFGLAAWAAEDEYHAAQDEKRAGELADSAESKALGANICFALGGGAAVGAAVLFFLEPHWHGQSTKMGKGAADTAASIEPLLGPVNGAVVRWRF